MLLLWVGGQPGRVAHGLHLAHVPVEMAVGKVMARGANVQKSVWAVNAMYSACYKVKGMYMSHGCSNFSDGFAGQ
jgi:hypothetical protein